MLFMNLSSVKILVGNIVVSLKGSGEIFKEVVKEISSFKKADPDVTPDIIYHFVNESSRPKIGIFGRHLCKNISTENKIKIRTKFYDINFRVGMPAIVTFSLVTHPIYKVLAFIPENMQRLLFGLLIKSTFSMKEFFAATFFYEVFEWTIQFMLMKNGGSYLHASAVADRESTAYIFAGAKQSGKTAILNSFLINNNYRLLSDDKLIIDSKYKAYLNGMYMIINPQIFLLSDALKPRFFENILFTERIVWNLFRIFNNKKITKRLPVTAIYNNSEFAAKANIKYCFYLVRTEALKLKARKITTDDFVMKTSQDIVLEEKNLLEFLRKTDINNSHKHVQRQVTAIYNAAFANAECFELLIPLDTSSLELGNFIKDFISEIKNKSCRIS